MIRWLRLPWIAAVGDQKGKPVQGRFGVGNDL